VTAPDPVRQLLPTVADPVDLDAAYEVEASGRHVRANFVASADGSTTLRGRSGPLSSRADREVFSVLRAHCDVVLVGAGTVREERYGPARPGPARRRERASRGLAPVPPIAVVTSRIDLDLASPFFTQAEARPIVLTTARAPLSSRRAAARSAEVVVVGDEAVDLEAALGALEARGLARVLCEGGPRLMAELVACGLLDELCLSLSPVLAGAGGPRVVEGALRAEVPLELAHVLTDGSSLFLRYRLVPGRRNVVA
jgi:riboflavin biosynthesis pyrimidine reductase